MLKLFKKYPFPTIIGVGFSVMFIFTSLTIQLPPPSLENYSSEERKNHLDNILVQISEEVSEKKENQYEENLDKCIDIPSVKNKRALKKEFKNKRKNEKISRLDYMEYKAALKGKKY
jgi:hypothetical protein